MSAARNRGWARKFLTWSALILLVAATLAVTAAGLLQRDWATPYAGYPAGGVFVEIPRGMRVAEIARTLEASGVVKSAISFRALEVWRRHTPLEAGEYRFEKPETPEEVFDTVAHGRIYLVAVTVREGETMFDIAAQLEVKEITKGGEFLDAAKRPALVADLAPGAPSLEGFLFPATYQFPRHQTGEKIAETMVRRFRAAWAESVAALPPAQRPEARLGPLQIVTLASLVEKETGVPEERAMVASVFRNRLRKKMGLDCDPTVIYALVLAGKYNGQLLLKDLREVSPYNTYRRRGLPPGPIANPGEASIRAALEPAQGNWLYFVATGEGGHVFSTTLKEHNRNVARYRQREAQARRAARAAERPAR